MDLRVERAWKVEAGEVAEVLLAVLAVAHAGTGPAVSKYAIDPVFPHDFLMH